MASNNDKSKPDQNASKPASEDFADVDWMIMSDLSTRIGGDQRSQQKQNPQQNPQNVNFSGGNAITSDDDDDLQWLQSLGLDEPIIQTSKSYEQQTSLISPQSSSQKSADVDNIDWLIVTDLKTKIEDSGIKAKKLTTEDQIPSPQSYPTDFQGTPNNLDLDTDLGSDLGLDSLGGLSFVKDDNLDDLSELDTLGFGIADDEFSIDSSIDSIEIELNELESDLESDSLNLDPNELDDSLDFENSLDASDISEWEQSATSFDDAFDDELPLTSSSFTLPDSYSSNEFLNADISDSDLSSSHSVEHSLQITTESLIAEELSNNLPSANSQDFVIPESELEANYQDYYDNADMLDFDSNPSLPTTSDEFSDGFDVIPSDRLDASIGDAVNQSQEIDHFAHDSFGQVQDLVNSGIDISSDEIWSSSDSPAIALDSFENFENNVDDVFAHSWEDAVNEISLDQAIDDSIWHSNSVVSQSGIADMDMGASVSEFGLQAENLGGNENLEALIDSAPLENDLASPAVFASDEDLTPDWQLEAEAGLASSDLEELSTEEDYLAIAANDLENFDSSDDSNWTPPSADSAIDAIAIDAVNTPNSLVNGNLTDTDSGWNTDIESVMGTDNSDDAYASGTNQTETDQFGQLGQLTDNEGEDEFDVLTSSKFASKSIALDAPLHLTPEVPSKFAEVPPVPTNLNSNVAPPPPFPPSIPIANSDSTASSSLGKESAPPIAPPPNLGKSTGLGMDGGDHDFLDDFDLDSLDPDITGDDFSEGFLPPSVTTTLNPPAPPKSEPTLPNISSPAPPPPPFLPPLPPKRPASAANLDQGLPSSPSPSPLPRTKPAADEFEQFHSQPSQPRQPRQPKGIDSVDQSWSELLDADTVLSGVLRSPTTPSKSDTAGRAYPPTAPRDNSASRDSRGNRPKKKTTELSDFNDLGIDIHDDNTDWSGLLDSVDLSDSLTSISESRTQLPPGGRTSQPSFAKDRTSISETREIPRRPATPVSPNVNQAYNQAPVSPPVVDFNRFTEDSYNGYGGGYGGIGASGSEPAPTPSKPSKTKMTMPSISIESLWQDYLKLPVIGLGAIAGLFLIYSVVNRPIFDLGLRWGIFKDARGKDFSKADLRGAKLDNVDFSNAILTGAKMQDASLVGANFQGANLDGVNFTNANMNRARLIQASVVWSEFTNAQMNLVDFAEADLTRSNFSGAKMDGANLKGAKIGAVGTEKATRLSPDTLLAWQIVNNPREGRNLSGQNLSGLNLSFSNLRRANLTDTKLNYTDMSKTDLSGANLSGSQINGVNWDGAKLSGVNLGGVDLDKTKLPKTNEETICPNNKPGPCKF